ncbi:MAG: putative sulfate exporter family transporter [Pseudomonadota bacterium]
MSKPMLGGVVLSGALAIAATAAGHRFELPVMLLALLFGMAIRAVVPSGCEAVAPGIGFAGRQLLRLGVALLGARVIVADLAALGGGAIVLVLVSVVVTLIAGFWLARRAGVARDLGLISATSVTICGASAALAAAAVMPKRPGLGRDTALVIVLVSLLSTAVMIGYPPLVTSLGFDGASAALILGGAIHDVAQVVGAGFTVSESVGVQAVTVKMLRVACLVPVVYGLAWHMAAAESTVGARRNLPWFLWVFIGLSAIASFGLIPEAVRQGVVIGSGALLLTAVAAIGLQTDWRALRAAPISLIGVIVAQTLAQLAIVVAFVAVLDHWI